MLFLITIHTVGNLGDGALTRKICTLKNCFKAWPHTIFPGWQHDGRISLLLIGPTPTLSLPLKRRETNVFLPLPPVPPCQSTGAGKGEVRACPVLDTGKGMGI